MIKSILNKVKDLFRDSTYLVILLYVVSILIIAPWGNYALADDFYYLIQTKAFITGDLTRSALIGPTIVAQMFLGVSWSQVFGLSYLSLRVLSIIISIFCILLAGGISNKLDLKGNIKTLFLLLFTFNPYFYSCSLNFMSENYFLFFILSSIYYFLAFIKEPTNKNLFLSSLLGGLSIMVRQYGFVLLVAYLLFYIFKRRKKVNFKELLLITLPFLVLGTTAILWPKYSSYVEPKSTSTLLFFASYKDITSKLLSIDIWIYVAYFLIPFTFSYLNKLNKRYLILILILAIPLAYLVYSRGVFNIGNLFYLEGLQARLRPNLRTSLFNNVIFKLLLSYLISVSLYVFIDGLLNYVINIFYKRKNVTTAISSLFDRFLFISIISLGFYFIVVITEAYFDRYFINFFLFTTLLGALFLSGSNIKVSTLSMLACILMCVITYFITYDYHSENKLKWNMAKSLTENYRIDRYDIFIDQIYASTIQMEEKNNYKGFDPVRPQNYKPICFIQEYSKQNEENILYKLIIYVQNKSFTHEYFKQKDIEVDSWNIDKSDSFDETDKLIYNKEYSSPVFNANGKRMYVRTFCTEDIESRLVPETGLEPASL